ADSVLLVFRHDRNARAAYDRGSGATYFADSNGLARSFQPCVVHAGRDYRPVLALCRYRMDFLVPAAVSDRTYIMNHQVVPVRVYFYVFVALLLLTATTVGVSKLDLGRLNFIVAITIAVVKGTLVVAFFMDARRSSSLTKLFIGAGMFWMAILLV